jgi:hypothetical protein
MNVSAARLMSPSRVDQPDGASFEGLLEFVSQLSDSKAPDDLASCLQLAQNRIPPSVAHAITSDVTIPPRAAVASELATGTWPDARCSLPRQALPCLLGLACGETKKSYSRLGMKAPG